MQMDIGGGKENVDARPLGVAHRLPGALDVFEAGAGQAGDPGTADLLGHGLDRLEVAVGSDGEAGLDDVHAQALELARHAQLLVQPHAAPW